MVKHRLTRLEKAVRDLCGGVCRVCYGHPVAAIHIMQEMDPCGPGFRKTGECYLVTGDQNRITDDLRCCLCGLEAAQVHLMGSVGIGPKPEGRRVCVG